MKLRERQIRSGTAMVVALVALLVVTLIAATVLRTTISLHRQSRIYDRQLQADWLADSAVARAAAQLSSNADFRGETWTVDLAPQAGGGVVAITVEAIDGQPQGRKIIIEARYPDDPVQRAVATRNLILDVPATGDVP